MSRDPLARALRNSPLFPCPDLDSNITPEDQERAGMDDCPCRGAWSGPDGKCVWPQCNPDVWGGAWRA